MSARRHCSSSLKPWEQAFEEELYLKLAGRLARKKASCPKQDPKTAVYHVVSESTEEVLGSVYWYGPWRQYIFQPDPETIWSRGCIQQLLDFLQKLIEER